MGPGSVVVPHVVDPERDEPVVEADALVVHGRLEEGATRIGRSATTEAASGVAVARAHHEGHAAEVAGKIPRVVASPSDLLGLPQTEESAGWAKVLERERVDDLPGQNGRSVRIEGAGERRRRHEQVGVAGRIAHRAEATTRQAGDGAALTRADRREVRVDPGDELVDVIGLPHRRAAKPVVVPVGVPGAPAGVGHHDDQRQPFGESVGDPALVRPRRVVGRAAVEEIEHGVARGRGGVVASGQQDADGCRRRQSRGCEGVVDGARRQPILLDQGQVRRRWWLRQSSDVSGPGDEGARHHPHDEGSILPHASGFAADGPKSSLRARPGRASQVADAGRRTKRAASRATT